MSELSLKSVSENYCKFQIKFSKSHDINQQYLKWLQAAEVEFLQSIM